MAATEHAQTPTSDRLGAPVIRLVDLHKSFGTTQVLAGVTLSFYPGRISVVLGPSGTGKSVLLKHIVALLHPDRGEVWFHDQRVDQLSDVDLVAVRKKIGFVFQRDALFDSMTVSANICFPLVEHAQMSAAQRKQRCAEALKIVGLEGFESKMPAELSGGERRRVALARAVVLRPQVVLYDEPTTGLDPIRADLINELILSLARGMGVTSIVVTHDMAGARRIADRMIMLYDGVVIADGDPTSFAETDNDLVRRFVQGQAEQVDLDRIRHGFEPLESAH